MQTCISHALDLCTRPGYFVDQSLDVLNFGLEFVSKGIGSYECYSPKLGHSATKSVSLTIPT